MRPGLMLAYWFLEFSSKLHFPANPSCLRIAIPIDSRDYHGYWGWTTKSWC
jgi:hypothetical protein